MIQQNYRIGIDGIDIDIKIDMHVAAASPSQQFGVSRALSLSWSVVFVWVLKSARPMRSASAVSLETRQFEMASSIRPSRAKGQVQHPSTLVHLHQNFSCWPSMTRDKLGGTSLPSADCAQF